WTVCSTTTARLMERIKKNAATPARMIVARDPPRNRTSVAVAARKSMLCVGMKKRADASARAIKDAVSEQAGEPAALRLFQKAAAPIAAQASANRAIGESWPRPAK